MSVGLAGRFELLGDSLAAEEVGVGLGESRIALRGGVRLDGAARLDLEARLDTLRVADFAFLAPALAQEGGARGRLAIRGTTDLLRISGRLEGARGPHAVAADTLALLLRAEEVVVDTISARAAGASFEGRWHLARRSGAHGGSLRFRDVDLRALAAGAPRVPRTALSGVLTWDGRGTSLATLDGDLRIALEGGQVGEVAFDGASAVGRVRGGALEARALEARLLGGRVTSSGRVALDGELDLLGRAEFDDLSAVAARLEIGRASGRGVFEGRIVRSAGRLRFEGTLSGERWAADGFLLEAVEATGSLAVSGDSTAVVASGRIGGISGYGRRLGGMSAAVRYEGGHLFLEEFSGQIAGVGFEARGEWMHEEALDRFLITSLALTRNGARTEYPGEIVIRKEGTRVSLLPVAFTFRGGRVSARAEYDVSGAVEVDAGWEGVDLSGLSVPSPLDRRLFETTSGHVTLAGRPDAPALRAEIAGRADTARADGFASLAATVDLESGGSLRATLHLRDAEERDRLVFEGELADSLPLGALRGGGGTRESLRALLRPDVTARADSLPMAWLRPLAKELRDVDGPLTATWRFHGDAGDLSMHGPFRVSPLAYRGARVSGIEGDVALSGGHLALDVRFEPEWGRSSLRFDLPARLDATVPSLAFDPSLPIAITGSVERGDLGILPLAIGQVRAASGDFTLSLDGGGTLAAPRFTGALQARNGTLFIRDLAETYEDVAADVTMEGDRITVKGLTARVGEKGRVEASGSLRLVQMKGDDFDFALRARQMDIESIQGAGATINADLVVRTSPTALFSRVPHITGTIDVVGGVVEQNFEPAVPGTPPPLIFRPNPRPDFTCEVLVRARGDLWIDNRDMEIELRGEGTLYRSPRGLGFVGSADAVRGRYYLYRSWIANDLKIERGEISWTNPDDATRLRLSAEASTSVRGERIDVTVEGPLDSLEIRATSDGGRPESEILAMLGVGAPPESIAASPEILQAWAGVGLNLLSRELLHGFGSVEFATERGRPQVSIGRYVLRNVYLDYTQSFEGWPGSKRPESTPTDAEALALPDRQLRVDYSVSRELYLEALTGSLRDGSRFLNLDLKVRVGY